MNKTLILQRAQDVLNIEAKGIVSLVDRLDDDFLRAVELLQGCGGKVVVTGMGKSGHIGRKIAATLSSTGTPAFFLHAGDAVHGDLGMVMKGDVVLAVSNSGETEEILKLRPSERFAYRVEHLLEKNRANKLNLEEEEEWENYQFLEHLVRMAKANASLKPGLKPPNNA